MDQWMQEVLSAHERFVKEQTARMREYTRRRMAYHGAIMCLLGGLAGGYISMAVAGKIDVDPRMSMFAHQNGFLGAFWLFGIGWTLRYSTMSAQALRWFSGLSLLMVYSNLGISVVKAALKVHGAWVLGERANDLVFTALTALVVIPTFVTVAMWIMDMRRALLEVTVPKKEEGGVRAVEQEEPSMAAAPPA